ncbi:hypothetical protein D3C75_1126400 [compost metagenome]
MTIGRAQHNHVEGIPAGEMFNHLIGDTGEQMLVFFLDPITFGKHIKGFFLGIVDGFSQTVVQARCRHTHQRVAHHRPVADIQHMQGRNAGRSQRRGQVKNPIIETFSQHLQMGQVDGGEYC